MIKILYFFQKNCVSCTEAEAEWRSFQGANANKADFLSLDATVNNNASTYNVKATPTWILFKNGEEVSRIEGSDFKSLQNTLNKAYVPPIGPAPVTGGNNGLVWLSIGTLILFALIRNNE